MRRTLAALALAAAALPAQAGGSTGAVFLVSAEVRRSASVEVDVRPTEVRVRVRAGGVVPAASGSAFGPLALVEAPDGLTYRLRLTERAHPGPLGLALDF